MSAGHRPRWWRRDRRPGGPRRPRWCPNRPQRTRRLAWTRGQADRCRPGHPRRCRRRQTRLLRRVIPGLTTVVGDQHGASQAAGEHAVGIGRVVGKHAPQRKRSRLPALVSVQRAPGTIRAGHVEVGRMRWIHRDAREPRSGGPADNHRCRARGRCGQPHAGERREQHGQYTGSEHGGNGRGPSDERIRPLILRRAGSRGVPHPGERCACAKSCAERQAKSSRRWSFR